jgi:hypothetical protein
MLAFFERTEYRVGFNQVGEPGFISWNDPLKVVLRKVC